MNNAMNHQAMMATTANNNTATPTTAHGDAANANNTSMMMDSTTSIDTTTTPTATSTTPIVSNHNNNHHMLDLYVVQKCWFAGPHVKPAVDYRRLFSSVKDAEQVAYQSAHRFAKQTVRTIQLQQQGSGGYGFVASGTLFWVRRVRASEHQRGSAGRRSARHFDPRPCQ